MLLSATVSGMPDWSRFASCCVNVASSCNFGLRFCSQLRAQRRRQERRANPSSARRVCRLAAAPALADVHRNRKKSEPLDLRQRRRPVGHFQNALDQFAAAPARLVGKFRHNSDY